MTDATHREVPQKLSSVLNFVCGSSPKKSMCMNNCEDVIVLGVMIGLRNVTSFVKMLETRVLNMLFYVICVKVQWIDDICAFLIVDT